MLKKLILIENDHKYQLDSKKEVVQLLLGEDYYTLSNVQKHNRLESLAVANCTINQDVPIVNLNKISVNDIESLHDKFVLYDEITYIYSLLKIGTVLLLEEKTSSYFTKDLDKTNIIDNYIIVNNFASELLEKDLTRKMVLENKIFKLTNVK